MNRMRHDRHADRVVLRRGERAVDQCWIVVGMNDVMARTGVLRLFCEDLLQNLARLELVFVCLVETVSGGEQRQRVEDPRLPVIGGIPRPQARCRTGCGWVDMAGLRGRPRSQDRGPARPGPSGSISGSAVSATLHTEG